MKEHCLLVLTHANPEAFARLVTAAAPSFDVVVHVDRRVDQAQFVAATPDIHFLPQRYAVRWGSFAMVQATLDLLFFGLTNTGAKTFTLVSGDTFFLSAPVRFRHSLDSMTDRMTMSVVDQSSNTYRRIRHVYLPDTRIGDLRFGIDSNERYLDEEFFSQVDDVVAASKNRAGFLADYVYAKGSQWWSLTRRTAERVRDLVSADPRLCEAFRFSAIPDESFFQTAVLKAGIKTDQLLPSPVYARWQGGASPQTFVGEEDFALLSGAALPLARKFSDSSIALLDKIEAELWV